MTATYRFGVGRSKHGSTTVHIMRDNITARCGFTPREWLIQADELPLELHRCDRCEIVDKMLARKTAL